MLDTEFIQLHQQGKLSTKVAKINETNDSEINCYKFQIITVVNEIAHRYLTFNLGKMKAVQNIEDDFVKAV